MPRYVCSRRRFVFERQCLCRIWLCDLTPPGFCHAKPVGNDISLHHPPFFSSFTPRSLACFSYYGMPMSDVQLASIPQPTHNPRGLSHFGNTARPPPFPLPCSVMNPSPPAPAPPLHSDRRLVPSTRAPVPAPKKRYVLAPGPRRNPRGEGVPSWIELSAEYGRTCSGLT